MRTQIHEGNKTPAALNPRRFLGRADSSHLQSAERPAARHSRLLRVRFIAEDEEPGEGDAASQPFEFHSWNPLIACGALQSDRENIQCVGSTKRPRKSARATEALARSSAWNATSARNEVQGVVMA